MKGTVNVRYRDEYSGVCMSELLISGVQVFYGVYSFPSIKIGVLNYVLTFFVG